MPAHDPIRTGAILHPDQTILVPVQTIYSRERITWAGIDFLRLVVAQIKTDKPEIIGDVGERFAGKQHGALKWIERNGNDLPYAFEITKARVGEKQRDRKQAQKREP